MKAIVISREGPPEVLSRRADTVLTYGIWYGILLLMKNERKITAMLPGDLLDRALKASGEGITPTLRKGLELVAAKEAYRSLLKLKGKFDLKIDLDEMRKDRSR